MARVLLILLCLTSACLALSEEVTLTVHSFPPGQVYLDTPTGLSYLGPSGQPLSVSPPVLRGPDGRPVQYAGGVLVLKAPDHADLRVTVAAQDWASGRLPATGWLRPPASSALVTARDYLTGYPLLSLVLAGGLVGGALLAVRSRRPATEAEQRLDTTGDPLVGKSLGRYRVEARLGQGGMGAVYRVVDDAGEYAAKVLYFDSPDCPSLDRFRREYKLLSQLQHPAFPRCFDYFEQEQLACCVMELASGQTMRKLVVPQGLPWSTVWPWTRTILEGLEYAHERGIVHRDLKPENLMVHEGQVKILDLGLARLADMTAITLTGQALGTPRYIAPEQVHAGGSEVDPRTDLYSLGVILYELLQGAPPFQAESREELVRMHLEQPAPPLEAPGVPAGVAHVVAVLLDKNPANRYASARRVLEVLQGLEGPGEQQDTAVVSRPSK
ncbi:MAG: hypothetical protein AMXMBFR33_46750 [Candidatus Xenobia bacterium]